MFPSSTTRTLDNVLADLRAKGEQIKLQTLAFKADSEKGGLYEYRVQQHVGYMKNFREEIATLAAEPGIDEYASGLWLLKSGVSTDPAELFSALDESLQWIAGALVFDAKGYLIKGNIDSLLVELHAQLDSVLAKIA